MGGTTAGQVGLSCIRTLAEHATESKTVRGISLRLCLCSYLLSGVAETEPMLLLIILKQCLNVHVYETLRTSLLNSLIPRVVTTSFFYFFFFFSFEPRI